jgi:hypothetical protein
MAHFNLHKITANSWIANTNGSPVAYIHRSEDAYTYMTPEGTTKFESMQAIKDFLGGKVNEQITEASSGLESDVLDNIDGFPVKHGNISVEQAGERPVYVRGKTQHVAGYWTIKFSKRWVPSFCPMLRTVEQYQSSGPFKNRLEMMNTMAALNRQK